MQTQSNKLDFNGQNIYVGFDVHLKSWSITIMTDHLVHKTFSQPPNSGALYQYLQKNFPGGVYHSAYEAGFSGYWIHNQLSALGINSIVVNPADIPTTNKEKVQKDDKRDSRKIARSLRNGELVPIYVPSTKTLEDRSLLRMRATLVKDQSRFKHRIKSFLYFHGINIPETFSNPNKKWTKRFMNWLKNVEMQQASSKQALLVLLEECENLRASILKITKQIRELTRTETYQESVKLLCSIPGVGSLTAMIILTELEDITRFSNADRLHSFVGIVPSTKSSGEDKKNGNITQRGHNILRTAIIESAWIAARTDPALLKCYHDYCKRMDPNKAIIRIAKKLLNRIKYVLDHKQAYKCCIIANIYK